jgi:hypothetical protein
MGTIYRDAARKLGMDASLVSGVVRGKYKQAKGYVFTPIEE